MRRNLLTTLALSTALTLSMGLSTDAHADSEGAASIQELVIEETGLASLDDLFNKVKDIDANISGAAQDIADTRTGIQSALGTAEGLSLEDSIAEFKAKAPGMVKITMEDGSPKLGFDPEAPEDIQKIVGNLNDAVQNLKSAKDKLASVPDDVKELTAQIQELSDPKKLKADAKSAGLKGKEIPGLIKKTGANTKQLKIIPQNAEAVVGEADLTLDMIKSLGD